MIQIFVDDRNAQQRLARLQGRFARFIGGLDPAVIRELDKKFVEFAKKQFLTSGGHGGHPWAALKERTVAMKAKKGTLSRGILRDSLEMYRMLTDRGSDKRRWETTSAGAKVHYLIPYFRFHQEGTKRMDPRPVFPDPTPQSFVFELRNTVRGFLLEGVFE